MTPDSIWTTSADSLLKIFRSALIALIPATEQAHIRWREPNAYDDWDDMCAAIYDSIVIRSLNFANEATPSSLVPRYDRRIPTYRENNFIGDASLKAAGAFICFETDVAPFDTCLFALLNDELSVVGEQRLSIAHTAFTFCRHNMRAATPDIIDQLNICL